MCQFKSGIVFRTGEVFTSPFTDSHEDLIVLRGLKDNEAGYAQRWVRVEYVPDVKLEKWTLRVDEKDSPSWFDTDMRIRVTEWFEKLIDGMTISTGTRKLVVGEQIILRGNAVIEKAGNGAHIVVMYGSSNVGMMYGSSNVGVMYDSSNVLDDKREIKK